MKLTPEDCLPQDAELAALVGRAWIPGDHAGPSPVIVRDGDVLDISDHFATVSELFNSDNIENTFDELNGTKIGDIDSVLENSAWYSRDKNHPYLLARLTCRRLKHVASHLRKACWKGS